MRKSLMKAGLLGYPIDHSLSPAIHRRAYQELGLAWSYELFSCEQPSDFAAVINGAKRDPQSWIGFNVTTPYKTLAYASAAEHTRYDQAAGGANVLTFSAAASAGQADSAQGNPGNPTLASAAQPSPGSPIIRGDNTDGRGLVAALKRQSGRPIKDASVVLCGSGSVAVAALYSLIEEQAAAVTIVCRDVVKAQEKMQRSHDFLEKWSTVRVINYGEVFDSLVTADFLIDATTVGMNPHDAPVVPAEMLHADLVVFDVVYGHGQTALLKAARECGAQAFDGLEMLIEQAALTIEIWAMEQGMKVKAPREAMRKAALET